MGHSFTWNFRYFLSALVIFSFQQIALGGGISKGPKPSWVQIVKLNPDATVSQREIADGYYFQLYDKQVNVQSSSQYFHYAEKIVNATGVENCSQIEFNYDKAFERIVVHEIWVTRKSGRENRLDLSKLKLVQQAEDLAIQQYNERMSGYLFLEDVQAGDIIECSYTRISTNPLFIKYTDDFQMQFGVPVCAINYRLLIPENRKLYFKSLNNAGMPAEKTLAGIKEYSWNQKDLTALKPDDYVPSGYNPFPMVDVSEYASWNELAKWACDIYEPVAIAGPRVKAKAEEVKAQYLSEADRIIASLRFVQDHIRYMGMETGVNTHKPHLPEQVIKQGFGDCKDKALLLCCLLREMKITAYPMLVNASGPPLMAEYLPSPENFNHVCVCVESGGKSYYFDPTISYQRGTINSTYFPKYDYGFIINRNSEKLIKLPNDASTNSTTLLHRFDIPDTLSPGRLDVTMTYTGFDADNIRRQFATNSLQDLQKLYLNFYLKAFKEVEVTDSLRMVSDDSVANKITTLEVYTMPHIWNYSETKNQWTLEFFAYNLNGMLNKPETRKRTMPMAITYPRNYFEKYEIKLGESWTIKNEYKTIENTAQRYTSSKYFDKENNTVLLDFSLVSKTDILDASEVKKYFDDLSAIVEDLGYTLFFNLAAKEASSFPYSLLMIFIFALTLGAGGFSAYMVYRKWDIVNEYTDSPPRDIGGWLILPLISVTITPFILLYGFWNGNFFADYLNDVLFNRSAANYNPSLGGLIVTELILNVLAVVISVLCLVLFYQKRSIFPRVYIFSLLFMFTIHFIDWVALNAMPAFAQSPLLDNTTKDMARIAIACVIWIPYMLGSYRVKETFTNLTVERQPALPNNEETEFEPAKEEINEEALVDEVQENRTENQESEKF
jgi:hypothetical protein